MILHTKLILRNETTIEYTAINAYLRGDHTCSSIFQEGPMKVFHESKDRAFLNPYNLSIRQNWIEVFGKDKSKWFKPIFNSLGDGVSFKTNQESYDMI